MKQFKVTLGLGESNQHHLRLDLARELPPWATALDSTPSLAGGGGALRLLSRGGSLAGAPQPACFVPVVGGLCSLAVTCGVGLRPGKSGPAGRAGISRGAAFALCPPLTGSPGHCADSKSTQGDSVPPCAQGVDRGDPLHSSRVFPRPTGTQTFPGFGSEAPRGLEGGAIGPTWHLRFSPLFPTQRAEPTG